MDEVTIVAQRRSKTGKGPARRLRSAGKLPIVLYGRGDSVALTIETKDLQTLRQSESGFNSIVDLSIEGEEPETCNAIVRDFQVDPVSRALLHADFGRVSLDEPITVSVPLEFINAPEDRLKLQQAEVTVLMYELSVACLPRNIPTAIEVDLSDLEFGDTRNAIDIALPMGVTLAGNEDETVVTTSIITVMEEEEEVEEGAEETGEAAADAGADEPASETAAEE
jgi:large subunit ribosomal protein L25